MTKRFGNFHVTNSKKQKIEENLDDLWGDDLDVKDVDDCFMLATQVWEQPDNIPCTQRNNVSILPPYTVFKQTSKRIFTSTQSDPELNSSLHFPSTSKKPSSNGRLSTRKDLCSMKNGNESEYFKRTRSFESGEQPSHLEMTVQKLQEQYVAKEGEVSILRTQLKEIRTNNESEQVKKRKEWSDKFSATSKQLNAVKSELEFKNLEIANLKQKVVEVAKLNNLDMSFNATQSPFFKQSKVPERSVINATEAATISADSKQVEFKLQPIVETKYPLKDAIVSSIFTFSKEEKYLMDVKNKQTCRNTIPFLQNQMSQDLMDKLIRLQPKTTVMEDDRMLNFNYVYKDLSKLMKCNEYKIECEENYVCINKMLCVSEQLMQNLYQFLQELEQSMQVENLGKINVMYLEYKFINMDLNESIFDAKQWCENEMGIAARQSIACISEILPYNSYLRGHLLQNKPLVFKEDETYLKYLPFIKPKLEGEYSHNFDYLNLILSVVRIIRRLKKSSNFPGFLSAVLVFLSKICSCSKIDDINGSIYNISREIILCSPSMQVLSRFTEFLKNASLQKVFVNNLCKMPSKRMLQVKHNERILYYNQDTTCVLQVLCVVLEDYTSKVQNKGILKVYMNISKFIFNAIECNALWLFHQEDKYCDCLCKIVKLYVDIMYRTIRGFQMLIESKVGGNQLDHCEILKSGLKILHIQNFRVYDLIVKYTATYSQYKVVVKSLLHLKTELKLTECDIGILENLNVIEEMPALEKENFCNIPLWN